MGIQPSLGPGSAPPEMKPVKGRKAKTGEVCTQGPKWGRKISSVGLYVCPWNSSITGKKIVQRGVLKQNGGTGWHQQWHMGAAHGGCVGRSWVAEAAWSQPVQGILCKYSQQGLTCHPSCHLKNLHCTEVMLSVCQGHHCSFS